jgi:alanine racemase
MRDNKFALNKLYIDYAAIVDNYLKLKNFIGDRVECAANIKSNAYGLGMGPIMRCLSSAGCNKFFVTSLDEALELRGSSVTDELYVLNGISKGEEDEFAQNHIIPVLNTPQQFEIFNRYCIKKGKNFGAVLNIDTGINRLGFPAEEAINLAKQGFFKQRVKLQFIMSHLACEKNADSNYNDKQLKLMQELKGTFQIPLSLANSSSVNLGKDYYFDIIRLGIMLYGCSAPKKLNLSPAVSLFSSIIQLREVTEDLFVGYDNSGKIKRNSTLATIPIGYADGLFRTISNKGFCYIDGYPAPIVGQISMDFIVLDVTEIPKYCLYLGAEVEVIGENIAIEKMAEFAGTTCHDILISLSRRLQRIYV